MNEPLIRYQNVQKAFGAQVIYSDLSLDVHRGETLTIIGPSGVGKSVMIKMLVGLLPLDGGQLFFDGQDLAQLDDDEAFLDVRRRVAMVFQGAALFDSLDVFDNIAYPLREQALREEREIPDGELKARVAEKLEWVGLPGIEKKYPSELSGGMRKRVGLARSIASDPEVILYDEPTTGLDPVSCRLIGDLILSLKERLNCTSVVVTHDVPLVRQVSDRLAFIYGGGILASGSIEALEGPAGTPMVANFLAGAPHTFQ